MAGGSAIAESVPVRLEFSVPLEVSKEEIVVTENEAIERAWEAIRCKNVEVVGLVKVKKITTAAISPSVAASGDFWSVRFKRPTTPGEFSPGDEVIVRVYERTGEAVLVMGK